MITWADVALCTDKDLTAFEHNAITYVASKGGAAPYIAQAKELIESRLRSYLKDVALQIDGSEVLDLISDVEPLRHLAAYKTLELLFQDCTTGGDLFERKAALYEAKYDEELPLALGLLSMDTDESGALDDSERYNVRTGVEFYR